MTPIFIIFLSSFLVVRFFNRPSHWLGVASDFLAAAQLCFLSSFSSYGFFICLGFAIPYALFDALIYKKLKLRMRFSFFHYFRKWRSFWDSAKELGLYFYLSFLVIWLIASVVLAYKLKVEFNAGLGIISVLGLLLFLWQSPSQTLNFLILEEVACLRRVFKKKQKEEGSIAFEKEYPLFCYTKQFHGEKSFSFEPLKGKKPHVIFYVLESFRSRSVHVCEKEAPSGLTPNFNEMASRGVLWRNFYCVSARSSKSVISSMFGVCSNKDSIVFNDNPAFPLRGLPEILKENGYANLLLQGGDLEFDSIGEFAKHHAFEQIEGMQEIASKFRGEFKGNVWGLHDEYLIARALDVLKEKKELEQPVFLNLFTISNHHPWRIPPTEEEEIFYLTDDPFERRFQSVLHYSDRVLGSFVKALEKQNLMDNTMLFIFGDHGQPFGEHGSAMHERVGLYDENVKVPLLLLHKNVKPKVIDEVASQMDLLPTVLDLLEIPACHHAMGRSLVRKSAEAIALLHSPFPPLRIGMRKGDWKWIFTQETSEEELYNLKDDPKEKNNLSLKNPEVLSSLRDEAKQKHALLETLFERKKFLPLLDEEEDRIVNLSGQENLSDEELVKLVRSSLPTHIHINGCGAITDEAFVQMAPYCKKLKVLSMSGCWKVSSKALKKVCSIAKKLEHLDISDCLRVEENIFETPNALHRLYLDKLFLSQDALVGITRNTPHLRRLSSIETANLNDETIAAILQNCPEIKLLKLSAKNMTDVSLRLIGEKAKHLIAIYISEGIHLTDEGLASLADCVNLCSAILVEFPLITGEFLKSWKKVFLYDFYLKGAPQLQNFAMENLAAHNLKQLQLHDCPLIEDSGILSFAELGINKMHVINCERISQDAIERLRKSGVVFWG
jgi:arylsulfatase A-like enzyme